MSDIENGQIYQPQRYPGDVAPRMPETVRIVPATVKEAHADDYTVDLMLNCPTPTNSENFGILFKRCLVLSLAGQTQGAGGVPWGVLALPCIGTLGLALFVPGAVNPIFLGGLLFPKETWNNKVASSLLSSLGNVRDWVGVHPSGVVVSIANTKEVTISQPAGASLVLKADGSVEVTAKATKTVTASAGGATVGAARLNDTIVSTVADDLALWTWISAVTLFINALVPGTLTPISSINGHVNSASGTVKVE